MKTIYKASQEADQQDASRDAPLMAGSPAKLQSLVWEQLGERWVADASIVLPVERFGPPASWHHTFRVPVRLVVAPDPRYHGNAARFPYVVAFNPDHGSPGCAGSPRVGCSSLAEGRRIAEDIYRAVRLSLLS
ncbi:MAG: hypothetical protein M3441_10390 [Chloroflexota bacterium]|nr:hypothetical protein [Chloroflexota bacterium]